MSPLEGQFERTLREMIAKGCNLDEAFMVLVDKYEEYGSQADRLIKIKQKLRREGRN